MGVGSVRALVALTVLAALGGCGPEREPSEPAATELARHDEHDLDKGRDVVADVTVEASGAAAFAWEGREVLTISRIGNMTIGVSQLSVGFLLPIPLPQDPRQRFRWAFDLMQTYDDEPGRFVMDPEAKLTGGLFHNVFLLHMRVRDEVKDQHQVYEESDLVAYDHYGEMREACVVEIGDNIDTGSISCPALATEDGQVAGYRATWTVVGPVPEPAS